MFLVTGCGKSGTVWASQLFRHLGYPCKHESQFSLDNHGPLVKPEVSWLAMPYVNDIPNDVPVFHIVRNPYHVVQSAVKMKLFRDTHWSRYEDFILSHQPDCNHKDYLTRVIRWVTGWDARLMQQEIPLFRVELSRVLIRMFLKTALGTEFSDSEVKAAMARGQAHRSPRERWVPTIDEINQHREGWRVQQRAERLGYL